MGANPPQLQMARKDRWYWVSRRYVAYMLAVALLSAGLVLLQHFCMTHKDGDFVTGYCLTDTHMRTVLAAILTVMALVLTAAATSAVEAYRCTRLAYGINEGVYIAMASQSVRYHLRAMFTPWAPVMLVIFLAVNAPQSLQTLVNLGIRTASVYVQNRSTAIVFNAYSYYNTSASTVPTDYGSLDNAISILAKMRDFRTSATSILADDGHSVVASIVRDGYVGTTTIVDNDISNAFKRLETVITITSTCTSLVFLGPYGSVLPSSPATVNASLVLPDDNFAAATVYTVLYQPRPDGSVFFNSTLSSPACYATEGGDCTELAPETIVSGVSSNCLSTLVAQDHIIIYTISADSVTPVQLVSNVTTVSTPDLADLMVNLADSPESTPEAQSNFLYMEELLNYYATYPSGSFNQSDFNIMHTKLCASASIALNILWTDYGLTNEAVAAGMDGLVGNAFLTYDEDTPLYNIVQLTHISTPDIAIITGVITGCACLVSLVGMAFAIRSGINIKPATDSSLLYNADAALIAKKQALQMYLSNDPDKQRDLEFDAQSMLYSRGVSVNYPNDTYHRINVSHAPAPADALPSKSQLYC